MAKFRAPFLFTETRLNLDQAYVGSTVHLTLAKNGDHDRKAYNDIKIGGDEAVFTKEHLATDASVYFRGDERYPRSFLWRLLDDRKTLELQSVDLSQDSKEKEEALLTLLLRFPASIRPFCIAFADPEEKDALNVFAITTADELWTLTLHKDFFSRSKATESLPSDFCKVTKPSIFTVTTPFRLFSTNARELYMSMIGGQVVRLTRRAGDDGSRWHDTVYSEGRFGASFSRALSWRSTPTVQFGDLSLEPSSAVSIARTAFDGDDAHLITVCLDHTLRIWNLKTGKISAEMDILGEEDQKYFIGANQRQLLQVVEKSGRSEFYVVTYSPKHHQFKFWAVFDAESGRQGLREMRPEITFTPPIEAMMDTAVWNLEEFYLRPSGLTQQSELWVRVRSGQVSQVFMLSFDPFDFAHKLHEISGRFVRDSFEQDWVSVSQGQQALDVLDKLSPTGNRKSTEDIQAAEVTEFWLKFLFYPGRFTVPLLETALETYSSNSKGAFTSLSKAPLKDRLTKAVLTNTAKPSANTAMQGVDEDMDSQWHNYYTIVRDLYKRRTDVLSFTVDPLDQLPWLVSSDCVSPIRQCSDLELTDANKDSVQFLNNPKRALYKVVFSDDDSRSEDEAMEDDDLIGNLAWIARVFRSRLPTSFQNSFKRAVLEDIMQQPEKSVNDRIKDIQERSGLLNAVSGENEERFEELVTDFGGYALFHTESFADILQTLKEPERGSHQNENITRFGARMLIRTAQETISLNLDTLLDLLAVVLYLGEAYELEDLTAAIKNLPEDTEDTMDIDNPTSAFDANMLFTKMMGLLRENFTLDFLTSNTRKEKSKRRRKSSSESPTSRSGPDPVYSSTLLESMFIGDWSDVRALDDISMRDWITYTSRAWLTKLDVDQYENFAAHVLADLIKHGDADLADQFSAFVPLTGWSTYLRGRLALEKGDPATAAEWFKKAAFAMSMGFFDVNNADTAELLRPDQAEMFSDGLPAYYQHVMDLLSLVKASSFVAEFAKLALQAHNSTMEKARTEADIKRKPLSEKQETDFAKLSIDLLSRLFTASIQTSQFDDGYSALTRMSTSPMRHFCLAQFINALIKEGRVKQLFNYPWAQLADEADAELAKQAKKSLSLSSSKPEFYKILYAWRIRRGNYRGASQAAFERLERLRGERKGRSANATEEADERIVEAYLLLINTMASVGKDEAWVLREPAKELKGLINGTPKEKRDGKRGLVTLEDVRREYQEELDRLAALEQGKFAFVDIATDKDEMDVL